MIDPPKFSGFADESQYNVGRYRGVGMVSLATDLAISLRERLRSLLNSSGVLEMKWSKVCDAQHRFAAEKLIQDVIPFARRRLLRIDVLTWDTLDDRHDVIGRDDIQNLHRMYHHLFTDVLRSRWPDGAVWYINPDNNSAIDWDAVQYFLNRKSATITSNDMTLLTWDNFVSSVNTEFVLNGITPVDSRDEPFVQLVDLFVGMGVFSRTHFAELRTWLVVNQAQGELFTIEEDDSTRKQKEKFQIVKILDNHCRTNKLGVGLVHHNGLRTKDPSNPINFWWYTPQSEKDKAPIR